MKQFKYTEKSKYFAVVSLVLVVAGVVGFLIHGGLSYGIDFTGGTTIQLDMQGAEFVTDDIEEIVSGVIGEGDVQAQLVDGGNSVSVKTIELAYSEGGTNEKLESIFSQIEEKYSIEIPASERNVTTISAATSKKILADSFYAVVIAVALMLLYITVRFEFLSGVSAVVGLIHNILIMIGFYALFKIPVNNSFVAAILTIVGYSINNTIVIFDRVRENLKKNRNATYEEIADTSTAQSLNRTINSSITTLITIGMLYILGVNSIREFALPIIIGIVAGTYASIFLCAPLWVKMKEGAVNRRRKRAAKKNTPGKKKYVGAPKKEDK